MEHVSFADYEKWPQVNASLLVHALRSWRQFDYVRTYGYQPKTDTRVGTALHSLTECLPVDRFDQMFVTMPDFKKSPDNVTSTGKPSSSHTSWVKEQEAAFLAENQDAEVMTIGDKRRCQRMLHAIQRNDEAMELIGQSFLEASITGNLFDVDCKGRLDGIDGERRAFWDLKTTRNVTPSQFGKTCANLHYLFKMAFYWLLLRENNVEADAAYFIAVQDSIPLGDGSWNEAADCVVYEIPMIALENQFSEVQRLLTEYRQCTEANRWPGIPNGPLVIPNWAMHEPELI